MSTPHQDRGKTMTERESAVRCNRCGLWKKLPEIARVLLSGGICVSCSEGSDYHPDPQNRQT